MHVLKHGTIRPEMHEATKMADFTNFLSTIFTDLTKFVNPWNFCQKNDCDELSPNLMTKFIQVNGYDLKRGAPRS